MKAEQIDQALHQRFIGDKERLVFWHDPDGEFTDYLAGGLGGELAGVQVLNVGQIGGLSAKLLLEREDTASKYLVYSQGAFPPAEEDWLLDIRLYSAQFQADMASLWLQELGLTSLSLRDHLNARSAFLRSQERLKKLRRLASTKDDEATLDLKMMAVLVGSPVASPFEMLRALYHGHVDGRRFDLSTTPPVIQTFEKMGLLKRFWELMRHEFSYVSDSPTTSGLLRRMFVSELFHQTDGAPLDPLSHLQLRGAGGRNAVVFLTQWRDSSAKAASYDAAADAVAAEQSVDDALDTLDINAIKDVYTFWGAEKRVVSSLKEWLLSESETLDLESLTALVSERKAGHWLSGPGSDAPDRRAISDAYDAVVAAAELFVLAAEHRSAMGFDAPGDLLAAYRSHLYRFDRVYRRFFTSGKAAAGKDALKSLADKVERVYDEGFLKPMGMEWSRLLDEGFLDEWSLESFPAQHRFYADTIAPHVDGDKRNRKRAYVIISDAFRYEAAKELTETLNGRYRISAELSAMLGVVPSHTPLGMASLLPHKTLAYKTPKEVLVDGNPSNTTPTRSTQLATVGGMACLAKKLRVMKSEEAREYTKDKKVVYIYHNVIDARGENPQTEAETFTAVSECIAELVSLVEFCVNKLNATKVWVTADHGFLYQHRNLGDTDKSVLGGVPEGAKGTKRYVIGRDMGPTSAGHYGKVSVTAAADDDTEFWVPRAANRFHFAGGGRFIHGGIMPQEIVVPLVTVTQLRGKDKEGSRSKKVSVQVLGTNHKITTPKYRFELIQTEAVNERRQPITLHAAVYDGARPVTSVETITCDSASDSMEDRKKTLRFELAAGTFDKTTPYRLILRDADTDAEVHSLPVVIDRSFDDEF